MSTKPSKVTATVGATPDTVQITHSNYPDFRADGDSLEDAADNLNRHVDIRLRGDPRYSAYLDRLRAAVEALGTKLPQGHPALAIYALARLGRELDLDPPPPNAGPGQPKKIAPADRDRLIRSLSQEITEVEDDSVRDSLRQAIADVQAFIEPPEGD